MPSFVRPSCILLIGAVVFSFQACGGDTAGPLPPARVAFATAPATPVAGETFSPAVQVEVQNEQGERVRVSSFAVTVQLSANPNGGVLRGRLRAMPSMAWPHSTTCVLIRREMATS